MLPMGSEREMASKALADGDADHADVYSRLALNWRSI
jgi:hypothetical protein